MTEITAEELDRLERESAEFEAKMLIARLRYAAQNSRWRIGDTVTNIKRLPEGVYFTKINGTEQSPYVLVRRTAKTATLRLLSVYRDPEWRAELGVKGCLNLSTQTWIYRGVQDLERTVRLTQSGEWKSEGWRFVEGRALLYARP